MEVMFWDYLRVFGAVAVTVAAGFIGAFLGRRGEHRKWRREQRLEAGYQYLYVMETMFLVLKLGRGQVDGEEMQAAFVRLQLLGPDKLTKAGLRYNATIEPRLRNYRPGVQEVIPDEAQLEIRAAKKQFIAEVRRVAKLDS